MLTYPVNLTSSGPGDSRSENKFGILKYYTYLYIMKRQRSLTGLFFLIVIIIIGLCSCEKSELEYHKFRLEELHSFYHLNDGYTFNPKDIQGFYDNSLYLDTDTICPDEKGVYIYSKDINDYLEDHNKTYYVEYYKEDWADAIFIIGDGCDIQIYDDNIIAEVKKSCELIW